MRAAGAFRIRPIVDARRLRGVVVYRLVVSCPPASRGDVLGRLHRAMGDRIWAARISLAGPLLVDMFGTTLAEPEETAVQVLDVPGVVACAVLILKESMEPEKGGWIDRQIAAFAAGRETAPSPGADS